MQGHKSSITTLSENLSFERGSSSSEPVIDHSQISWNNMQPPPNNQLPTNLQFLNPLTRQLPLNAEWSLGETSRVDENNERKQENAWPSNTLPQNININLNPIHTQPQDHLNTQAEFSNSSDLPSGSSGHISRQMPCKRKSPELQSSVASGSRTAENGPNANNGLEQPNSRLGLGPEYESSRRNCRLRINGLSRQQDYHGPLNPTNLLGPANPQLRWAGPGGTRVGNFSASGQREAVHPILSEPITQNALGSISEHPIFAPASDVGSLAQQPVNWNFGSVGPSSRAGTRVGTANSSEPSSWANRGRPHYSRRLSDIGRRSLLTLPGGESSGPGNQSQAVQSGPSQGVVISSGPGNQSRHFSVADGAYGLPNSLRNLAAAGEGRTNLMSEHIRHVLDLMRRGEGLRLEDVMILDRSLFFGMANRHDLHRDMRLDIDNMSYEELLALGERIGNVCTGLNEGTIMSRLKQTKYVKRAEKDEAETEPCSICREEYINGENLGILDCGHEFHRDCIKQWLRHKNLCPICKMTGLTK
ncbi:RING/U-box superfamily protein [Striga asiatica]|uniref:RING-type E3 ubiquitin transferase n=1 Tax=Striga asiatica TaxID=4170 RepID=A0A5A7PBP0_STRAF|nr:RING/U-box superfamily protein [Striga asiatica]